LGEQQVVLDFSHLKMSVISALPKHVKDKYEAMHVPGQSGRRSAGSVVVGGSVGAGVGGGR